MPTHLRNLVPRDPLTRMLLSLLLATVLVFVGGAVSLMTWPTPGWSAPASLPRPVPDTTDLMDAAMSGDGTGFAVWDQRESGGHRLYAARFLPDAGWTLGVAVDEGSGSWLKFARLAVDAGGDALAVWYENYGPYSVWANRYSSGEGWGTPRALSTDDWNMTYTAIPAMDARGNAIVAWSRYGNDPQTGIAVGMTYSERLSASAGWEGSVFLGEGWVSGLVLWSNGTALATLGTTGGSLQLASLQPAAGPWSSVTVLNANESTNGAPLLCSLGDDRALAVWERWNGSVYAIGSSLFTGTSGWSAPVSIPTVSENGVPAALACDPRGDGLLVWSDDNWGARNLGASWWDSSSGWSSPFLVGTPAAAGAEFPIATLDPQGNAIVVWSQQSGGGHAYAGRIEHDSATSSSIQLDGSGGAAAPIASVDSQGDVLVVWMQTSGDTNTVWSRHYFAPGSSIPRISLPWTAGFLGGAVATAALTARWWRRELRKPATPVPAATTPPRENS